jgi:hypothetical protein
METIAITDECNGIQQKTEKIEHSKKKPKVWSNLLVRTIYWRIVVNQFQHLSITYNKINTRFQILKVDFQRVTITIA